MRKRIAVLTLLLAAVPGAAQAHVSLHPNTLPAGSNPTVDLRVPSEEPSANTVRVAVQFPPGFLDVSTGYLPGWTARKVTERLPQPVKTDEGTITEQVREVVWSGGKIPPESFLSFPFTTAIPDSDAGESLEFKTVQTYSNGKTVRWIGPADSEEPAPNVNVTDKGGVIQDVAGSEAGPAAAGASASQPASSSSTSDSSSDKASKGLGVAALVIGIAALIVGLVSLVLARRRSRAGTAAP